MSIMAKTPSGYKKIGSAYLGERPVDKVFNANGDVVYALQRELTGVPPLLFKGKEQSELLNYRIYGDTVDGNSVGDLVESGEHTGEYKVPVTVEGKNLLDEYGEVTRQYVLDTGDISSSVDGDMFLVNKIAVKPNTAYTFSWQQTILGANNYPPYIRISSYDSNNNFLRRDLILSTAYPNNTCSMTTPNNIAFWDIRIDDVSSSRGQHFEGLMLNEGSTALPYEPYHAPVTTPIYLPEQIKMIGDEAEYIDYGEQKQHRVRKNLLQNTATSQTINGVTFTVNSDGSVTCNGTASATALYLVSSKAFSLPVGNYKLNGAPTGGGSTNKFKLDVRVSSGIYYPDTGDGIQFNILQTERITMCRIAIYSGYTCDNLTFYPMIRKADIEDNTYEPYIEDTDLDVTLPALPTIKGTNTMSIDTTVQPSRMDIKGRIKTLT